MSEFKISRLRFSWAGEWEDQKFYNKDEIVQHEGKAYVCLIPHTSNGFQADLTDIEPKWELMMTGQTWKGPWEPFTLYSLDNIVLFGGIVYKCNTPHVSSLVLDTDIDKWDVYAESKTWQSEWESRTTYGIGDIVQYGGSVYECIISHVSADTDLEGLEVDYDLEDSTERKWKILTEGTSWRGEYATSTQDSSVLRYKLNDLVRYGPTIYKCIKGHAPANEFVDFADSTELYETFIAENWEEWLPGLDFDGLWDPNVIYQPGDVVLYGGYLYTNKVINNINTKPSFNSDDSTDAWEIITKAYDVEGEWEAATEYKVGSIVTYGGDVYVALVDSTGESPGSSEVQAIYEADGSSGATLKFDIGDSTDPNLIKIGMVAIGEGFASGQSVQSVTWDGSIATVVLNAAPDGAISDSAVITFAGVNSAYWELLIPGIDWKGRWQDDAFYYQDDLVYWGNATYKCIREHTSSLVSRPDNDLSNSYWVGYLQHYQRNILKSSGEMAIYNGTGPSALQIGAQSTVLKIIEGLPTWSEIDFTPAVYYVATNGADDPSRGTTFDTAWKTIKYACERVKEGTENRNAKTLIEQNKEFLVQESFYWFINQQNTLTAPFDESINFDNEKTIRDLRYIVDALVFDLSKGGNSQIVANTLAFFDLESTNRFTNDEVEAQIEYFIAVLVKFFELVDNVLNNTAPAQNYQTIEGVANPVQQYFNNALVLEPDALTFVGALENIILSALSSGSPVGVPAPNERLTTTINIKSGTYEEILPIVIPSNSALNGDELRGVAVKPANPVNTLCTRTIGFIDQFVVGSTVNMEHNTPVQFDSLNPVTETSTIIGGINRGQTYYVIGDSITDTTFQVSETPDGPPVPLLTNIGFMYVYGGTALSDMFYVQNGTGIRNMTLTGLLGTLTEENEYLTRRPTGGAYVSLDPGEGPDDTDAWITYKSPYIQNVTNFGKGCTGLKIDSTLHNGGNRSIVCNDFTQIMSDGIGIWCTGGDALCEAVSVFSYYNYAGYFSEAGGRIRATNGNSSYGTFGCVAEGFDPDEIPATGRINNKSNQASASAVSALGSNAEILKIQYNHAGEEYTSKTVNMLKKSNEFLDATYWTTDGNISTTKAPTAPFENEDGWRVIGDTSLTDSSYLSQTLDIAPQGKTYTNVAGENITGSGIDATFDVTVFSDFYVVAVNNGGSGYVVGNQIKISGQLFGGQPDINDIIVTVETLAITSILTITHVGTVPQGSALPYTPSIYAKKGTAQFFDLYITFSGYETKTSYVRYNFDTNEISTERLDDDGIVPVNTIAQPLEDGWYRISFKVWDRTAQNTQLEYKLYPRGINGLSGYTDFFGAQLQIGDSPTFYLKTEDNMPTAYANINIRGAGSGLKVVADELRSGSVFQSRVLEGLDGRIGGVGYKIQTNNAQTGTTEFLTLAQSEVAEASEYEGMRLTVSSGRGAGQYGIISKYSPISKQASILKESFESLEIVATELDSTGNLFKLAPGSDVNTLYVGQKIQFTPTFYDIIVSSASQSAVTVTETVGDLNNLMKVSSTARLRANMAINFTGEVFGGVITNFTYYILNVVDETTIQISTSLGGGVWPLNTETGSMTLNYPSNTSYLEANTTDSMEATLPIQFTGTSVGGVELGTTYYIQDVINDTQFTVSASLISITATNTSDVDNSITIDDTSVLKPMNPIIFKGTTLGGIQEKTRYYVNSIVDGTNFTISSSALTRSATATQAITNLITVDSTAGFVPNSPIIFTGTTFGNIVRDKVYYIQVVNDATTFTISESPGGAALTLTTATGEVITRTTSDTVTLTTETGSMVGNSTGDKFELEASSGTMGGSFFTEVFGGITQGTTYYIQEIIPENLNFTITATPGGITQVTVTEDTGSMQIGEVGWDHINSGTPNVSIFDSTSVYTIEPRLKYSPPPFIAEQIGNIPSDLFPYTTVVSNDFYPMIIPRYGSQVYSSSNCQDWDISIQLPVYGDLVSEGSNGGWIDAAFGNSTWVIISETGSDSLVSVSNGVTWLSKDLPTPTGGAYSALVYGNGNFVAVARGSNVVAYSNNNGGSWSSSTQAIGDEDWVDVAYGNETFVAISGSSDIAKYSTDGGATWSETSLSNYGDSTINNWRQIKFGNGRFVAISEDKRSAVYSFDGITWYESNLHVYGTMLEYGQGVFVLVNPGTSTCYTSPDGINWKTNSLDTEPYTALGFTFDPSTNKGYFLMPGDGQIAYRISAGVRPQARARVDNTSIVNVSMWEPGSGYSDSPAVVITDPNNSQEANLQLRIGNGTLGAPSFVDPGSGFNTASTTININGDGYADQFQTGLRLIAKNVTRFPSPGDNLEIEGNSVTYRVANATILKGTTVPNLEVEIRISPQMTEELSPADNDSFTIRSRFSQVRLTNHDYLNIGFGNEIQSNYPGLPENTGLEPQDEVVETNNGRVFYSSTDQDGNFRVGDLFAVEQATGIVTLNASEFGLEGLTELTIGGVALGGSPVIITEFSTDGTFVANSNNIVPTQRAIRTYLASRLSQGGSDTFTGLLTAGTVKIGGPDEITSTVPEGGEGWQVKIGTKANIAGPTAAWAGDGLAMSYFMKTFFDPTRESS